MTPAWIDLNADAGEDPAALADGREAELLACVTSVNVACGGHAGTDTSMAAMVALAREHGVALGAHPSYPDRDGFGRRALEIDAAALGLAIATQVRTLADIADRAAVRMCHVKPHGALYNVAARDPLVAAVIASALDAWRGKVRLVGLAGSQALEIWRGAGFEVAAEAFADRRYEPDGSLRRRQHADALIDDAQAAARQATQIATRGAVTLVDGTVVPVHAQTLCVHGDTPNAIAIARTVRAALEASGVQVRAHGGAA